MIYVIFLNLKQITIHLIREAKIALLVTEKITVPAEYLDYTNIFLKKLAIELFKRSDINKHLIDLEPNK